MQKIEGLYTAIATIINEYEDANRPVMDVETIINDLKREVDVYSASLDWYIKLALRQAVSIGLWQKGYRSVVRGKGLFVNPDDCNKPEYLARLFNNAKLSEVQQTQVVNMMKNRLKETGIDGQLTWAMDGTVTEDVTEKQLLEMLESAVSA